MVSYTSAVPKPFSYFPNQTTVGSSMVVMDYCPFYEAFSDKLCTSKGDSPTNNYQGEIFGSDNSRCFTSSLNQILNSKRLNVKKGQLGCYENTCLDRVTLQVSKE